MPLELHESQIRNVIPWFNNFLGLQNIRSNILRAETKLKSISGFAPYLDQKFFFHKNYEQLVRRNRLYQRLDFRHPTTYRILSFIAATNAISKTLSDRGLNDLRRKLLSGLDPSNDIREIEHELRAFVHYSQSGLEVTPWDLNGHGQFDYLVSSKNHSFEVECKTFANNLGNPISNEEAIHAFELFKSEFAKNRFSESGFLVIEIEKRIENIDHPLGLSLRNFLELKPQRKAYGKTEISFERRPQWEEETEAANELAIEEIAGRFDRDNKHFLYVENRNQRLAVILTSRRRPTPIKGIIRRIRDAATQVSGGNPAVIWCHFMGLTEAQIRDFGDPDSRKRNPLEPIAYKIFESENRKHVSRLRFSADAATPFSRASSYLGSSATTFSYHGSTYEFTSRVTKFDLNSSNEKYLAQHDR